MRTGTPRSPQHIKLLLQNAIKRKRSEKWCLTLWSRYIRQRDDQRCVLCYSTSEIQAHHIFRRTLYPDGKYQLGNGITLCANCHSTPHSNFNGRPDLSLPIDAEGGDNQDVIAMLFGALIDDAETRGLDHEIFYYIEDSMLEFFVKVQGYEELLTLVLENKITRLTMAFEIWKVMPENFYARIFRSLLSSSK